MKTIKYLFLGALFFGYSATAMAQTDNKSIIDAISIVIKENPANAEAQVKEVVKKNKKNIEVLCGIGRAYLDIEDTQKARQYADMAMKVRGGAQHALPHILLGDIYAVTDDGGNASMEYEQAIIFDKMNPEPYRKYAQINSKVSPEASAAKLEELRKVRPDYPVDVINATIYMRANNLAKAVEYYDKVNKADMESSDLVNYSLCEFLSSNFDKSREIASFGAEKFPRHPALNRLVFFNSTNLKDFDTALTYADRLFNRSDSAKITSTDYLYYGHAYNGKQDYDKAIEMFRKSIEINPDAKSDVLDAMSNIANAYREKGDYNNAITEHRNYLGKLEKVKNTDYAALAQIYLDWGAGLTGSEQTAKLEDANKVYDEMIQKFADDPNTLVFAYNKKTQIDNMLDPNVEKFLALPDYTKLIEIIEAMPEKSNTDRNRLVTAYHYLAHYNLVNKNESVANEYWNKILSIDPTYAPALDALGRK